ncbi:alpha/beta fold hydrolase [Maridesulfovibrio salexigens]|uniref:Alpha/beta hydrolase fold protein n=1 Tax=Maridesulfovibrio salexigens (strain ATCC 14822 / DSM 2638 / NCIMB 8403 / VKM B-1763) TaxID=526222 RepID=C6BS93_MARSD|nr:alpha/beta hydrolase [Maridesulfovibrio salexigens]ACS79569.1 alpha/beta hydrolase fold protein [Maridesulfovibrio salexigens DSM 2638]
MSKTRLAILFSIILIMLSTPGLAESVSIPFKNSTLHYTDTGKGERSLVLIHGWACDTSFWNPQITELSKTMRVIAIDLPGHGKSSLTKGPYMQKTFAEAVATVMDSAGIKSATLGGHSMGASVIRWVAHLYPKKVNGLIIIDGALLPYPKTEAELEFWDKEIEQGFRKGFTGPDSEKYTVDFIDSLHGKMTPENLKVDIKHKMMATPAKVRTSSMINFLVKETWNLPQQELPTMAVYAMSPDSPPNLNEMLESMFKGVEYTLFYGPGHFLMLERPQEINCMIRGFMKRHGLL